MDYEHASLAISAVPPHKITDKELNDWINDPYITIEIVDAKTEKPIMNKIAHVYYDRAEYKKVDPGKDLIFDSRMWTIFNGLMLNIYDELIDELNYVRIHRLNIDAVEIETMPCYMELPYITRRKSIMSYFIILKGEL